MKGFEDILAWQKAKTLTLYIYGKTRSIRDFGFKDQIQKASVSIMNNIAEGFERGTKQEFIRFLYIAKGSCGEVRSMLSLGADLAYFSKDECYRYNSLCVEISKMLYGLIRTLVNK